MRWTISRRTKSVLRSFLLLSSCTVACNACAQSRGSTTPSGIVDSCVNLAGVNDPASPLIGEARAAMKSAGITRVRIPLYPQNYIGSGPDYAVDPGYLASVGAMARDFTRQGFSVILDLHGFQEVKAAPAANTPKMAAFWAQAARSWRTLPRSVAFEILNEPGLNINGRNLPDVLGPSIQAIRQVDQDRQIIIGGAWSSHFASLPQLRSLMGPNITPTFHFYEPMKFTHQGAQWNAKFRTTGKVALNAAYQNALARAVRAGVAFGDEFGTMPLVGEIGVIGTVPADVRRDYLADVSQTFARAGMQTCLWSWPVKRDAFDVRDLLKP